jgi:NAD(P)-dependent dehydrogenase (short-subunit alcohol dehydrogenase family)
LGQVTADALAAAGANLALCARDGRAAIDAAEAIAARHGVQALGAGVDVSDPSAVDDFAALVDERLGPPALVVNNAAVLGPVGALIDTDLEAWAQAIAIDVVGVASVIAAFARRMVDRGGGAIVNLSGGGIGGPGVAPRISAYTTSKAAVALLTETVALELGPFGVRVNAIAPGAQPTGFTDEILRSGPARAGADLYEATARNQAAAGDVTAYVRLLFYVASPEGSWLTGRLLSARWDTPERLAERSKTVAATSLLQLRRIDDDLYSERSR